MFAQNNYRHCSKSGAAAQAQGGAAIRYSVNGIQYSVKEQIQHLHADRTGMANRRSIHDDPRRWRDFKQAPWPHCRGASVISASVKKQ
ncbi:MAG: hypothetical protein NTV22_16620 [bacterium]|nr:hypothetical protein [bacterium]